jgi:pimeloyl-ACP methyl ester carboxylesterase
VTEPAPRRVTTADGVEVAVHRWGLRGELPPVVLLHGFASTTHGNWVRPGVVPALVAAGREVIGVDARGHGESDKPREPRYYGEPAMASDVRAVADALGLGRYDLAGYSMGAIVALLVAAADRRVRRLVVGGIGAGVVELGGLDTRRVRQDALIAALEADDPSTIPDAAAAGFRAFADASGADRLALAAHARVVHTGRIPLRDIAAPTLVLAGEDDPLAVRPQLLADAIPGARLRLVPGNHLSAVAVPAFGAALVEFLGEPHEERAA